MIEWVQGNETLVWWLVAVSIAIFIGTILMVPLLIVRIPHDYFSHERRHRISLSRRHPLVQLVMVSLRNALGLVLVVAGILMLVLPGQGILTILAGIVIADFPGKYRLERWVVSHQSILDTINWFRRRSGRVPLVVDD